MLLALMAFATEAQYTIYSVSGSVIVESSGKQTPVTKGMALKATDVLIIPQDAKVEVYNDLDKRIYSSIHSGKISVTKLMVEAHNTASNHRVSVGSQMRFGKKKDNSDNRVYAEKGMVHRSLAAFDPEGDILPMDAETLGRYLAGIIAGTIETDTEALPVEISHGPTPRQGLAFRVENTLDFPIYFNIIKVGGKAGNEVSISQLGQAHGSYLLLPCQSISREHLDRLPPEERHFLVMTHDQYDFDRVIDEIRRFLSSSDSIVADRPLPIYVVEL